LHCSRMGTTTDPVMFAEEMRVTVTLTVVGTEDRVRRTSSARPLVSVKMGCPSLSMNSVGVLTVKMTPMFDTGFPLASSTVAKMCVERDVVMRLGSAVTMTRAGSTAPILTVAVAEALPVMGPGAVMGEEDGGGAGTAAPPDTALTVAVPDRLSDTRLTRAAPFLVFPSGGSIPPTGCKNGPTSPVRP